MRAREHSALLLLSAASGAADAFVFICVGQVFAGVMTGNLVLLGASAAGAGEEGVALRVVTALLSYGCGVAGAALAGERLWRRVPVMLLAEVALLAAAALLVEARARPGRAEAGPEKGKPRPDRGNPAGAA